MNFISTRFHFYIALTIIVAVLTLCGDVSPLILYGILIDRILIYSVKKLGL